MDAESDLSWKLGPGEARLIRVCLYLSEGLLGGLLFYWLLAGTRSFLPAVLAGDHWLLGVGVLFVLALARWAWFWLWLRRSVRDESNARWWLLRDWLAVYRPSILAAIAVTFGVALLAVDPSGRSFGATAGWSPWFPVLFAALLCNALATILSSKGELDPESLTLSTFRYAQWRDLDLRLVSSVRRVTVGDHAILWVSLTPGAGDRITSQGFYSMPARTLDRNWHAFETGMTDDSPLDADELERALFFRKVNRAVAVGFFGLVAATAALLVWSGMPHWHALQLLLAASLLGTILFKLAI